MQTDKLTDQEINEAVARKLGWIKQTREFEPWKLSGHEGVMRSQYEMDREFNYCTSIQAAWEIMEKYRFELWPSIHAGKWVCRPQGEGGIAEEADTAPMAICEAFLKLP